MIGLNLQRIHNGFNVVKNKVCTIFKAPLKKDVFESSTIDILAKGKFPSNILSNFAESHFELDGVKISSMEGFLQALKTPDVKLQKEICKLVGKEAKQAGVALNETIFDRKTLHWNGKVIDRFSDEYQELLTRAYDSKFESDALFRKALKASEGKKLIHSIGLQSKQETVLTEQEFISQLDRLRQKL